MLTKIILCQRFPLGATNDFRAILFSFVIAAGMTFVPSAISQIIPDSPSTQWVPLLYGNTVPDPSADQQTGSSESDIVGNAAHPSLYMKYNDGGTPGPTNGFLAFRLRLAADVTTPGFKGAAFVGLDANLDGKLDVFIGVNNQGSGDHIGIWDPGAGQNISPSTTSMISPSVRTYNETSTTYSLTPVSPTSDPFATSLDIDGGGKTDQFLSFVVPFGEVAGELAMHGITGFTKDTPMRLVAATATQDNSLNQDLNGVASGINSGSTWDSLGVFTLTYSPSGIAPAPEPPSSVFCLAGFALFILFRRKKLIA
jgi:hypothetical protein